MADDYYELLDVPRDASTSEIKQAYRDRIKETHPDVSDDRQASERTKRLIEAKDVLTDEEKRSQYDRVGHEQFVSDVDSPGEQSDTDRARRTHERQQARTHTGNRTTTTGQQSGATRETWTDRTGSQQQTSQHAGPSWSQSKDQSYRTENAHQTWSSDRSYTVGDDYEMFEMRQLFDSQQAIVLLGSTFIVYPILLAGALLSEFPTAANLGIALCTILVIAYLQSLPQVGIVVFGIWSVLLPIGLFGIVGADPFTLSSVLAVAAVLFPFGLSILTWLAVNPSRQL